MKKFKKIAAAAAAVMCAAAMTVSAGAKLVTVPQDGFVRSSDGSFLVMLYSDGTFDKNEKDPTDYGIDLTKIATVEVTVKATGDFTGDMGGGLIMSSKSNEDASTHNWPSREYWGVNDDDLAIYTQADKAVKFETVSEGLYKATLKLEGSNTVIDGYNFVQFAIQDWGGDVIEVQSIVMKDASGAELISFDSKGKASLENIWGQEKAEETTAEETEAPEETTAEETKAETTEESKEETTETEVEEEVEEDTTIEDDSDGVAAEPNWVGAAEGSGTEALAKWISYDKLGSSAKPCLVLCSEDDNAEPPADSEIDFKVSDIYGFRVYTQIDQTVWDSWHGGQVGTNSALGGWKTLVDYSTDNDLGNLTIDVDAGTFTYLSDTPLFDQAEQDQGGYAHIWLMDWSSEDALRGVGFDILDKDGNNLLEAAEAPAPTVEETAAVVEEAPAPTAGDVAAATDSSKGNPNTGVEDVAAVAGLALVAAGAVVIAKKRK